MNRFQKSRQRRQRLMIETLERRCLLTTFTVNSTSDENDSFPDDGICDTRNNPTTEPPTPPSEICTLRAALIQSFVNGGSNTIEFDIPGDPGFIPEISDIFGIPANTTVDGTTQPSGQVIIQGSVNISGDGVTLKGFIVQGQGINAGTSDSTIQDVIAESMSR